MTKRTRLLAIPLILAIVLVVSWANLSVGQTTEDEVEAVVDLYRVAAPDLVINTATGAVKNSAGETIVPALMPAGETPGRFDAAGYATTLTKSVVTTALGQQAISKTLVKSVSVIDTTTGAFMVKDRIYYSQPLTAGDLR